MCAVENGWTDRVKTLEKENRILKEEIRILRLRMATAKKLIDDIADLAGRIN